MNEVRTLLTGRGLVESPRWHDGRLYFSDWSAGEVIAVDLAGHSEVVAYVKSLPLCTAFLPDGRLVIVSSADGRLLRREPDGSVVTHAELGSPGWNDSRSGAFFWARRLIRRTTSVSSAPARRSSCSNVSGSNWR